MSMNFSESAEKFTLFGFPGYKSVRGAPKLIEKWKCFTSPKPFDFPLSQIWKL
jgi:hypothetical protein